MDQPPTHPASDPPAAIPGLPAYLTSFLGREEELGHLRDLLLTPSVRLVTITGFGGIGKTRLATVAVSGMVHDWRRIWFVSLALVDETRAATHAITRELGIEDDEVLADRSIRHDLQTAPCLLVLDNFEHVVDAADQIPALLGSWPLLTILITSRTPLNLSGEHVLPLSPLATTDETPGSAIQLFHERARAHGIAIGPEDDATVEQICRRLEGIPLAIELAAARVPSLNLVELRDRLTSQLSLLTGGPRDAPARQRTLRDTIAWSYDLLGPTERQILQGLSVFSGGFTVEAAGSVLGMATSEVMDRVGTLVASSLVQTTPPAVHTQMRYRLLDPVREFAFDRLANTGTASSRHLAHARYFTSLAEDYAPRCSGPELPTINRLACAEADNFRSAMAWALEQGEGEIAVRLAGAIWRYWPVPGMGEQITWRGRLIEGRRWIELAMEQADGLPLRAIREALLGTHFLDSCLHDVVDTAIVDQLWERGLAEDDPSSVFHAALYRFGGTIDLARPVTDVEATLDWLTSLARQAERPLNSEASVYLVMSGHLLAHRQLSEATPVVDQAIVLAKQCGNPLWQASAMQMRSELELQEGRLSAALASIRASMAIQARLGVSFGTTAGSLPAARIAIRAGDATLAAAILRAHFEDSLTAMSDNWFIQHRTLEELSDALGESVTMDTILATPLMDTTDHLLDTLENLLREQATFALSPSDPAKAHGLSPREVEVLRFLAEGHSNHAIAGALFISERTVENHVRSILDKLGVANRAGAAAWAVRHDLA